MTKAKTGDTVKVHVTGKLEDGTLLSTSQNEEPIQIALGKSKIIDGIQEAVVGMEPKQTKTVKVPPEKAFGTYRDDLIKDVPKDLLPDDVDYQPGEFVELPKADGKMGRVKVIDVSASNVKLDLNHPLAGRKLVFDITLVDIL